MKKILILMLVLGLTSTVNATLTLEVRESDGVTEAPLDMADEYVLTLNSDYVLVVSSDSADDGTLGGVYGPGYVAADWAKLGPADSTTTVLDTGDLSYINWYAPYQGYEFQAKDSSYGPGVHVGDWFGIDLTASAEGTFSFGLLDYRVSSTAAVDTVSGTIVPEPITIALLGLGGLFLRRRK